MVLWPVELNTTANPRTRETNECRLDDVIVVDEMAPGYLVISHLHTTAQFGQNHHFDIFVFKPNGLIVFVHLFIAYRLDDRIGIDYTT